MSFSLVEIQVYARVSYFYDWIVETTCSKFPNDAPPYMNCNGRTTTNTGSTAAPSGSPSDAPTATPTILPTTAPTSAPVVAPTSKPTATQTPVPSRAPTSSPDNTSQDGKEEMSFVAWTPTEPLGNCQGDCDSDLDCAGNLECFQRDGDATVAVPGCNNSNQLDPSVDVCYNPNAAIDTDTLYESEVIQGEHA